MFFLELLTKRFFSDPKMVLLWHQPLFLKGVEYISWYTIEDRRPSEYMPSEDNIKIEI